MNAECYEDRANSMVMNRGRSMVEMKASSLIAMVRRSAVGIE